MASSHPPTLLKLVRRTLLERCALKPGDHLLLAVSGGGDSQALLDVVGKLRAKLRISVSAHGVDHGLRAEAAEELELARQLAVRHGITFSRSSASVQPGSNLQARARDARYRALRVEAERVGATAIVTAHHAEDRAETVLLRLLRGAGLSGLKVLPPRSADLMRPMIGARKQAVVAHLNRHHVAFAADPSNLDRRFLRVRVRSELLPLMASLSPGIVDHLNALADEVAVGPPPSLRDSAGRPVLLSRAQITELRRVMTLGIRSARIKLAENRQIRLDPITLEPRVELVDLSR